MREAKNIQMLELLDIDWIGFIFYPGSPRYVSHKPSYMPKNLKKIGVFVNESIDNILRLLSIYELNIVQLHGDESPDFCLKVRERVGKVIKSLNVGESFPLDIAASYEGSCDYFLFDRESQLYGGSGNRFNWELLNDYSGKTPFLLSGGISYVDVQNIKEFYHPQMIGIDINSRFEHAPALKDIALIESFINQIR